MLCPKCHGEFKVVNVKDRETGKIGYALECSRCEYINFDIKKYALVK